MKKQAVRSSKRGSVLSVVALVVATGIAGTSLYLASYPAIFNTSTTAEAVTPTAAQVQVMLVRAGLTPDALAAAGVSQQSAATVIADAKAEVLENYTAFAAAEESLATAAAQKRSLDRLVKLQKATEQQITDHTAAVTQIASAQSTCDAVLADVYTASIDSLSAPQRTALAAIKNNRTWSLPLEYLVMDYTEAEFVQLRNALGEKRVCDQLSEEPCQATTTLLQNVNAHPTVIAAKTALDANLAGIENAWESAMAE